MPHDKVPKSVLAAARSATVGESELLNSERIARRFGNYSIDVIDADDRLRRSNLYSVTEGEAICRTFAVVRFGDLDDSVAAQHAEVVAGRSIGAIFKARGWAIRKKTLFTGELRLDGPTHPVAKLMRLHTAADVAMHVYRLQLERHDSCFDYATITEVHHPQYLDHATLRGLYPLDVDEALQPADIEELIELVSGF